MTNDQEEIPKKEPAFRVSIGEGVLSAEYAYSFRDRNGNVIPVENQLAIKDGQASKSKTFYSITSQAAYDGLRNALNSKEGLAFREFLKPRLPDSSQLTPSED